MNIFYNRFCLSLQISPKGRNFHFEFSSFSKIEQQLTDNGLLFEGQVFYLKMKGKADEAKEIFGLCTWEPVQEMHSRLTLVFENEARLQKFLKHFTAMFKPVTAAGGIVTTPGNAMLLIFRNGLWDLPKGKREGEESIGNCALREVEEETGLKSHSLGTKFQESLHCYFRGSNWKLKRTYWYHMPAERETDLVPQEKEGITDLKWFEIKELKKEIPDTYPQIEALIRDFISKAKE